MPLIKTAAEVSSHEDSIPKIMVLLLFNLINLAEKFIHTKLVKIGKGIVSFGLLLIEILLIALFLLAFFIRTSRFQTFLAQELTTFLTGELGKKIDIQKVDIIFFDRLDLEGIFVEDKHNDTLLIAKIVSVNIGDWDLKRKYLEVDQVTLGGAYVNLNKQMGDSTFNFQHLIDYFATNNEDTSATNFKVTVQAVALADVKFKFDNFNELNQAYGIDYNHMYIKNLNGTFSDFAYEGDSIKTHIDGLNFKEQSGLILNNLSATVLYSPKIISLKKLNLALEKSLLQAEYFELMTPNGAVDFGDFLNQVKFNAKLHHSIINLNDIAYFVPQIQGMTDDVNIINANVTGVVNGMKIRNTEIRMLENTILKGNFQIPNLDDLNSAFLDENITLFQTSIEDIEAINLSPFIEGDGRLKLASNLKKLYKIQLKNGHFTGFITDFVVDGVIQTGVGNLYSENGLKFKKRADGQYYYQGALDKDLAKDLIIEGFDVGILTDNKNLGKVNGYLQILPESHGFSLDEIDLLFNGAFQNIYLNGYEYHNIAIKQGRFHKERFTGELDIEDDNLALNYNGYIDFKNELAFNFDVKIDSSFLTKLKLLNGDINTNLKTNLHVNLTGNSLENIRGDLSISSIDYFDGTKRLNLEEVSIQINRKPTSDFISIESDYVSVNLDGQFNFEYIYPILKNQIAKLIPNLIKEEVIPENVLENFTLQLDLKNINPVLSFFDDNYYLQPNTQIDFETNSIAGTSRMMIGSEELSFEGRTFKNVKLVSIIDSTKAVLDYKIAKVFLTDSLMVDSFSLYSTIQNNELNTQFGWIENQKIKPAFFEIKTTLSENNDVTSVFSPSYFHLQDEKWNLLDQAFVLWNPDYIEIKNLEMNSGNHFVKLDGKVSKDPEDWLNINIKDFDLASLNSFLGETVKLDGILNLNGGLSDVYDNTKVITNSNIKKLGINDELVGDVNLNGKWNKGNNALAVEGDLTRNAIKSFDFDGLYYVDREKNSLDVNLKFEHTDIGFLNAFSDPELYTNIRGSLDGSLKVKGELDNPIIIGDIMVESTSVNVPMFNVDYTIAGLINFNEGEIIADYLEITDQIGNQGIGMLQVYHTKYSDWNYDVTLDLEDPNITKTFLAMNTFYKEGDIYYGKAFITGNVNIFGYDDLTEINVDLKTKKGTDLTLPLYGTSEIEEGGFVKFYNPDTSAENSGIVKLERLGMTLKMNFNVTEQAKVNIVFDPILNDRIEAKGIGDIEMNMDNYGDISMFGKYKITQGVYHFNMKNVVKEDFEIMDGSTVVWTQSPYDANIDIKTRFKRNVDISDIIAGDLSQSSSKELVYGYLNLSNTLLSPELKLDIEAPEAKDDAQSALSQIRGIEDELYKQFFSLLIFKKFIPVEGSLAASGNVTEDLVNQQINAVLGQIGDNYNLNSDIGTDHAELGFSTSFLDDRLKVTTSVGVISSEDGDNKASNIVGDVNVEYELNKDGTFSVNVFNESNETANQDRGAFTQGFGLSYQESFNSSRDFKLWQGILNIFRKKENKQQKKKNNNGRKVPVAEDFKPVRVPEQK